MKPCIDYDIDCLGNWSLKRDLMILINTVVAVFKDKTMLVSIRRQLAVGGLLLLLAAIFAGGGQLGAGNLFVTPWDKLVHLLVFGCIGFLVALGFPSLSLGAVLLTVAAVGAADEFHQMFLASRQAAIDDWLADLVGGLLTLPAIPLLRRMYGGQCNIQPTKNSEDALP